MRPSENLKELAEAPLGRLLFKYSWPALVSMTFNALYSVVDRFWIGRGCGEDAMAALTLSIPLTMVFGALGVWVGAGHSAVLSIKLGEGDRVAAEKTLGELLAFKLLFFLVFPPLVFLFLDPILRVTGGASVTPSALVEAKRYLQIVLLSHIFSHIAFGLSAAMRSEGAVFPSMGCMVVGFGLNLVLDPLFIFGFKMGVSGAAWATNVAMAASCACALAHYLGGRSVVRLRWGRIRFVPAIAKRAMGIGLSPFLQQIMGALITFSLQMAFAKWASSKAAATRQLASLGIFQVALLLFLMPVLGVQQGLGPIMGYNWGARNYARVRHALMMGLWLTTAIVSLAAAIQVFVPESIVMLFTDSEEVALRTLAAGDLRISNCMLWCIGLNIVASTYFQSIGRPKVAIVLSTLRQGVCLLPCIWILPYFFKDHAFGIWLSMPVSDVLAFLATIPPFLLHVRFLSRAAVVREKKIFFGKATFRAENMV